jgi:hypothetical protein
VLAHEYGRYYGDYLPRAATGAGAQEVVWATLAQLMVRD